MHIKKSEMPKTWPVARKGKRKRFIAVPSHAASKGITLLLIFRDMLAIASTRREVKKILQTGDIKVNCVSRTSEVFPVLPFDVVSFEKTKKDYRLMIVNKKFSLKEISSKESNEKIIKVIGKVVLNKKDVQMNLEDGTNMITKESFSLGDSIILNLKTKKIDKVLPLKKGAKVSVVKGKHVGKEGELLGFEELSRGKDYVIKLNDGHEVILPLKTIIVVK